MTSGERIKKLRIQAGITQNELAIAAGVKQSSIALYENDRRTPNSNALNGIATALGVSSDFLIRGVESDQQDVQRATGLSGEALRKLESAKKEGITPRFISQLITADGYYNIEKWYSECMKYCCICGTPVENLEAEIPELITRRDMLCAGAESKLVSMIADCIHIEMQRQIKKVQEINAHYKKSGEPVEYMEIDLLSDKRTYGKVINGGVTDGTPEEEK